MAMTAYFGSCSMRGLGPPAIVLSGFGGTARQWFNLETRIARICAGFDTSLGESRSGVRPRPAERQDRLILHVRQVLEEELSFGISGTVHAEDYREHYRAWPLPRGTHHDSKYAICFRAVLFRAVRLIEQQTEDWPLDVIFDLDIIGAQDAVRVFDEVKAATPSHLREALGTFRLVSRSTDNILAALDILSCALFRSDLELDNSLPPLGVGSSYQGRSIQVSRIALRRNALRAMHRLQQRVGRSDRPRLRFNIASGDPGVIHKGSSGNNRDKTTANATAEF